MADNFNDEEFENEDNIAEKKIQKRKEDLIKEIVAYLNKNSIDHIAPDIEGEDISAYHIHEGYDVSDYQFHFNGTGESFLYVFDNNTGNVIDVDSDLEETSNLYKDLAKIVGYVA